MPTIAAPHLFTREAYHKMASSGVLTEDDRVELIQGEIIDKVPIGASHGACVKRLNRQLFSLIGGGAIIAVQDPLSLGEYSESEPDLMLLELKDDYYANAHPTASDVLLLIEVSDTSIVYDRKTKLPLYASHLVAEVWIIDLQRHEVTVFRNPSGDTYTDQTIYRKADSIQLSAFPGKELALADIGL